MLKDVPKGFSLSTFRSQNYHQANRVFQELWLSKAVLYTSDIYNFWNGFVRDILTIPDVGSLYLIRNNNFATDEAGDHFLIAWLPTIDESEAVNKHVYHNAGSIFIPGENQHTPFSDPGLRSAVRNTLAAIWYGLGLDGEPRDLYPMWFDQDGDSGNRHAMLQPVALDEVTINLVKDLIVNNDKIKAVKTVRATIAVSLLTAKEIVDEIERGMSQGARNLLRQARPHGRSDMEKLLIKRNTNVKTNSNGETTVTLWGSDIVVFDSNRIVLDNNDWPIHTTKERMNQVSKAFKLGFRVYQKDYKWYVEYRGQTKPFTGGVVILRPDTPPF